MLSNTLPLSFRLSIPCEVLVSARTLPSTGPSISCKFLSASVNSPFHHSIGRILHSTFPPISRILLLTLSPLAYQLHSTVHLSDTLQSTFPPISYILQSTSPISCIPLSTSVTLSSPPLHHQLHSSFQSTHSRPPFNHQPSQLHGFAHAQNRSSHFFRDPSPMSHSTPAIEFFSQCR